MNINDLQKFLVDLGFRKMEIPHLGRFVYGKIYYVHNHRLSLRTWMCNDEIDMQMFFMTQNGPVPVGNFCRCLCSDKNWKHSIMENISHLTSIENISLCDECRSPMTVLNGGGERCANNCPTPWEKDDEREQKKPRSLRDTLAKFVKKEENPWELDFEDD